MEIVAFVLIVCKEFHFLYLGNLSYFLGLEAKFVNISLYISHWKYSIYIELLQSFNMLESKPIPTPETLGRKHLSKSIGERLDNPQSHRSLDGAFTTNNNVVLIRI